ncbi:alcohol dehydrogenase catalytic domain-containing protein [bacterium]|nr:alcohol dehydrogenase catalytic domain-containing protein [bacterium]
MKTAQINGEKIVLKEIEDLKLNKRKGAIVKVLGCGLCGSDIVKFKHKIAKDGTVLGHEIVAIIEEINSETNFKVGDKIVSSHHIPCFNCTYCQHGNFSMCSHFKETNIIPGGFSEKVYLSEEHLKNVAHKVPNNLSNEEISFYEPLGCCIRAIKRCNLQKDDNILVVGLGSIGLIMSEAIKALGYKVYACDILDERIKIAQEKNIEAFNSTELDNFNKIIKEKTNNLGVDAVFMTSGADKAIEVALRNIKLGGKILVFSSTPKNFGYANNEIYYKELTILGSYSPSPSDLKDAFELLTTKKVDVKGLTTMYTLDNIQEAFEDTISNKIYKAYISIN